MNGRFIFFEGKFVHETEDVFVVCDHALGTLRELVHLVLEPDDGVAHSLVPTLDRELLVQQSETLVARVLQQG